MSAIPPLPGEEDAPLPALASWESGLESKERLSSWFLKSLNFCLEPQLQFVFKVENL